MIHSGNQEDRNSQVFSHVTARERSDRRPDGNEIFANLDQERVEIWFKNFLRTDVQLG